MIFLELSNLIELALEDPTFMDLKKYEKEVRLIITDVIKRCQAYYVCKTSSR
jgi:hypothetical protein